ncbi:aldose 1-epimerase family protein [Dyadobacter sp. CY356]|uniref:aldose 1-epimerase family protein n=1 Tax=Dyadobacter sp. CY356 TaxID=2906442 RepID=UPI001F250F43|nr:aldose 1-epimerase family protein [Dyadobacter sp. CY356]MCF0058726.1 aldose 1-epimerase family protein [Dyadobacter sp. CY356]
MATIENDILKIGVSELGAELCEIHSKITGKEYMWDANPDVWGSYAPVLFPVIGAIKDGYVLIKGQQYKVPRHGFIRNNPNVKLVEQTENSLTYGLKFSEKTLQIYPYEFEFLITFSLDGNKITVSHKITNLGNSTMFFSLGGHPAFKCPVNDGEEYEDYYLEFEKTESAPTWLLEKDGLVGKTTKPVIENSNILPLTPDMFDNDALIFKNLDSTSVSLKSKKSSQSVHVNYSGFPYLGVWAKPNAKFVCIEPWLGIADNADSDHNFETKEGILKLVAKEIFNASYSIEIKE